MLVIYFNNFDNDFFLNIFVWRGGGNLIKCYLILRLIVIMSNFLVVDEGEVVIKVGILICVLIFLGGGII